jgi:LuxR family maltose regulon positive regulatory protein
VEAIKPVMEHRDVSDAHRVMWAAAEGWFELVSGSPEKCIEISVNALELADKCGVHLFDYKFHGMATQANLILGKLSASRVHIDGYLKVIPGKASLLQFHAHLLSAWHAWLAEDSVASREQLAVATHFLKESGSVPIIEAKMNIASAILHFDAAEYAEAKTRLTNAERIANATGSLWLQYHCLLLNAGFARQSGDHDQCLQNLRGGFQLGREHGLIMTDWWDAPAMSGLCEIALDNDIERLHVCSIIEKTGLQPGSETIFSVHWPWPVRIEVLGHFKMVVQGKVVSGRTKSQKKVLELIKALIALGGKQVSATKLADALWPDAEGDDARNALKTNIHRLRKLLGGSEVVELKDGYLSLCTRYCWVDALVFSALAKTPRSSPNRIANFRQALKLYHGRLLAAEEDCPWTLAPRKHLQKIAHEIVMELGVRHEGRCKWSKAIRVYRKGLDADPIDEQICRHLMQCYQQSGHDEAALDIYEQCCSELKMQVARNPCARTRLLAESIIHA